MFAVPLTEDAELRPLEPWHAEELLAHMDRGREFIGRFIPFPDRITDVASSRAILRRYAELATADTGRMYGIWLGGTLVGGVMFKTMNVTQRTAEAGCWLEPAGTGRGLVTRAIETIVDWAVGERGIHRIEWQVAAGNEPSIAVARRLGMTRDGVLREALLHHGERHDVEIWSVLAPEWRARRSG